MQFDDKRRDHLAKINLENSRVNVRDAPIIFLCGGKVDVKSPYPLSLRQALIEHLHKVGCTSADQITLAEEFEDWLYDGSPTGGRGIFSWPFGEAANAMGS